MTLSVEEAAKEFGYAFKGSCHCDGYETLKYKNADGQLIYWRKYKQVFRIVKHNSQIKPWTPITELQKTLENVAV